jgi:RNA polymerase primary sigma factor
MDIRNAHEYSSSDARDQIVYMQRQSIGKDKIDYSIGLKDKSSSFRFPVNEDPALSESEVSNLVLLYFNDATRSPLLTASQDVELSKSIERGRQARKKLTEKTLDEKELKELQRLIIESWDSSQQLIIANSRLVISIAKKYLDRGLPFLDLIQEGNIGLMRALKKFEYRRGFRFGTYATWWIRQSITRAIANKSRTIRIPAHMSEKISNMYRVKNLLKKELVREPSKEELAIKLDISIKEIDLIIKTSFETQSLEKPIGNEQDLVLGDVIEDDLSPSPEDRTSQLMMQYDLSKAIDENLLFHEARIIRLRFGLEDGKTYSKSEIGQKFGVSLHQIRQIEMKAMAKLKNPKILRQLKDYME